MVRTAIIDVRNKERGVTYVYESHSYWDREKKQPRSHRRLIGKRDPETGEIVPTRSRRGSRGADGPGDAGADYRSLHERALGDARAGDEREAGLRRRVASLEAEVEGLRGRLDEVRRIVG